ncbi:hypothetical protein T11_15151 [Trichinella zimbabwensis]|uniref:Uncharacterized protein n=1 Tax=Trichinella zimbabwensis TaxID=268475 RepID=A0A0V1HGA6_9BILA|nr:hypothetical protein T11_15151 [Trichinella zimbabwensis]
MCSLAWSEQPRCQKYFNLTLFQQLTTGVVSGIWDDADRYGQIDRLIAIPLFTGEKNKGGSWCCVTVVFVPGIKNFPEEDFEELSSVSDVESVEVGIQPASMNKLRTGDDYTVSCLT